ncbi:hypothetical protein G7046_g9504 [Stylonectria norvegica]|nr:hypothetical protein G7046_g9504 [Stylonectria norvegica]
MTLSSDRPKKSCPSGTKKLRIAAVNSTDICEIRNIFQKHSRATPSFRVHLSRGRWGCSMTAAGLGYSREPVGVQTQEISEGTQAHAPYGNLLKLLPGTQSVMRAQGWPSALSRGNSRGRSMLEQSLELAHWPSRGASVRKRVPSTEMPNANQKPSTFLQSPSLNPNRAAYFC